MSVPESERISHPTKIAVYGERDGVEFKALMDMDRFCSLIDSCNREFGGPGPGPELRVEPEPLRRRVL